MEVHGSIWKYIEVYGSTRMYAEVRCSTRKYTELHGSRKYSIQKVINGLSPYKHVHAVNIHRTVFQVSH